MNQDNHSVIGHSHHVCEDFSLSGVKDGVSFAVVSDGCSGSENTDWGSRFLCKAVEKNISLINHENFHLIVLNDAIAMRDTVGLQQSCLDATLLIAYSIGGVTKVRCFGDGVIAFIMPTEIIVNSINYGSGAPFYLNYISNLDRLKSYTETFSLNKTITSFSIDGAGKVLNEQLSETNSQHESSFVVPDNAVAVCLMSDGVESFYSKVVDQTSSMKAEVKLSTVLSKLLAFKGYHGQFAYRRLTKFLKDNKDFVNDDDVSLAVLYLNVF